jgi:hypothetical protein
MSTTIPFDSTKNWPLGLKKLRRGVSQGKIIRDQLETAKASGAEESVRIYQ